MYDKESNDE